MKRFIVLVALLAAGVTSGAVGDSVIVYRGNAVVQTNLSVGFSNLTVNTMLNASNVNIATGSATLSNLTATISTNVTSYTSTGIVSRATITNLYSPYRIGIGTNSPQSSLHLRDGNFTHEGQAPIISMRTLDRFQGPIIEMYYDYSTSEFGQIQQIGNVAGRKPFLNLTCSESNGYGTIILGPNNGANLEFRGNGTLVSTQRWTSASSNYTGFAMNVLSNNSAGTNLLLDMKVNGATVFSVDATGSQPTNNSAEVIVSGGLTLGGFRKTSWGAVPINSGGTTNLGATHSTYLVVTNGAVITLPTAVGTPGRVYTIKAIDPAISVVITNTSSQTIDGVATYSLTASNKFVTVQSDNANWQIIGGN